MMVSALQLGLLLVVLQAAQARKSTTTFALVDPEADAVDVEGLSPIQLAAEAAVLDPACDKYSTKSCDELGDK